MSVYPPLCEIPQDTSVVSRWLLDEASGNALDDVGSNELTDNNTVGAGTGYSNGTSGVSFDNSRDYTRANDEYFNRADNASLSITGSITVAGWFRFPDYPTGDSFYLPISKATEAGSEMGYYMGIISATRNLRFSISPDGTEAAEDVADGATGLDVDTWHHLTGVFESSTRVTVYVNGSQDGENTTSIDASIHDSAADFILGHRHDGTNIRGGFEGQMQDVVIWNTALTDAEVSSHHDLYTVDDNPTGCRLAVVPTLTLLGVG